MKAEFWSLYIMLEAPGVTLTNLGLFEIIFTLLRVKKFTSDRYEALKENYSIYKLYWKE